MAARGYAPINGYRQQHVPEKRINSRECCGTFSHEYEPLAPSEPSREMSERSDLCGMVDSRRISKMDVFVWLTGSSDPDARWILRELYDRRPHIFPVAHRDSAGPLESQRPIYSPKPRGAPLGQMPPGHSIIQFSSPTYYCTIEESTMTLEVIRIGDTDKKIKGYI